MYQASHGLPGRIKIRWNSSHKNHRKTRSFTLLVFMFLTSFCLVCLLYMPTSYRPIVIGIQDDAVLTSASGSDDNGRQSLSAAVWSLFDPSVVNGSSHHQSRESRELLAESLSESRREEQEALYDKSEEEEGNVNQDNEERPSSSLVQQRLPACIIIGGRKCGTRALLEFIGINSRVVKARDEVHFFDEDSNYSRGLEWYRRQMPYSSQDQITIEKTPAYFVTEAAPDRIQAMNESIKLIFIVRDPVIRLISDYAQLNANKKAKGERPLRSFSQLVFTPEGDVDINFKPVKTSIYAYFYSRWTETFPASQILVVNGDELVSNPFSEVQRVEDFLGIEHEVTADHFVFNATKGFYCMKSPGSLEDKCLNETKGRRHPKIPPAVVHTLRKFYAPYNHHFYTLVGKNFNWPEE